MSAPDRTSGASGRRFDATLIVGRLQAHGRANYLFEPRNEPSYFLRLTTERGPRTVWGRDLERAIAESQTQPRPGDLIGARRTAREIVTRAARRGDAASAPSAYRTRWRVEKVAFFAERARLARRLRDEHTDARSEVRDHPELLSTYLTLRGATLVAEQRLTDPTERARFLKFVREAMAASVKDGHPLPTVRLRNRTEPAKTVPPKRRDEPTR